METQLLSIKREEIAAFCRRWRVRELDLFGSALRDDFGPESDIDVLVAFEDDANVSLFDLTTMQDELQEILGKKVDLVEREGIERSHNWIRRRAILDSVQPLYRSE